MWIFKHTLWHSTKNILPIHWNIWFLYNIEILRALRFKSSYAFLKRPLRQMAGGLLTWLIKTPSQVEEGISIQVFSWWYISIFNNIKYKYISIDSHTEMLLIPTWSSLKKKKKKTHEVHCFRFTDHWIKFQMQVLYKKKAIALESLSLQMFRRLLIHWPLGDLNEILGTYFHK